MVMTLTQPGKTNMLSDEYVAGFLDADGYVSLSKCGSTGEEWRRRPEVCFTNCDRGILEKIAELYDGGKWQTKKSKSVNHNVSYMLRYRGDTAIPVMRRLLPYSLHQKKRMRMQLMLDNIDALGMSYGVKYTDEMIEKKTRLVEKVMGITMIGKGAY